MHIVHLCTFPTLLLAFVRIVPWEHYSFALCVYDMIKLQFIFKETAGWEMGTAAILYKIP